MEGFLLVVVGKADLELEIQKAFVSEEYGKYKKEVLNRFKKQKEKLSTELEKFATSKGFTIQQSLTELVVTPVKDGKPFKGGDYDKLSGDEKKKLDSNQHKIYERIYEFSGKIRDLQKKTSSV